MYKTYIIIVLLHISFLIHADNYRFLNRVYTLEFSAGLGVGNSYLISGISDSTLVDFDGNILPNLNLDSQIIILETIGLYITNRTIYQFDNNILENNLAFGLTLRPVFIIRLLKNYFTDDYYTEFFYNSISFHIGGVMRYLTFSQKDAINLLGVQLGLSTNFLLSHSKNRDFFVKIGYSYNFIEDTILNEKYYDMNGFYYFVALGLNFRFGESIDWLTGTDPNKKVKVSLE